MVRKSSIDWEDVKYFLETMRSGSARGTAQKLGTSHSTVSRRIENLEKTLQTRLFDKTVKGYQLTNDGEALAIQAEQAENHLLSAERMLSGRDAELRGEIRLTMADAIANHLVMDEIADFTRLYPDIDVEIVLSSQVLDLNEDDVDIALRLMPNDKMPPEPLIGRILSKVATCYYATREYLDKYDPWDEHSDAKFIGWGELGKTAPWPKASPFSHLQSACRFNHSAMHVEAAKENIGIARLPCFIADSVPQLVRVDGCEPEINYDIWLLSTASKREVARLRIFRERLVAMFERKRDILLGRP